jgi:hypothetical protein
MDDKMAPFAEYPSIGMNSDLRSRACKEVRKI